MRTFRSLSSHISELRIIGDNITKFVRVKEYFNNELDALFLLNHPYIIKYNLVNPATNVFEFPYYKNGNLIDYIISKSKVVGLSQSHHDYIEHIKPMCKKILYALEHCHLNNVLHCDIKPDNIVLDEKFNPILIDFGHAFILGRDTFNGQKKGSMGYIPPELSKYKIGTYTDIYSLGMLFHTMFYHKLPLIMPCGNIDMNSEYYRRQVPYAIENLIIEMLDPIYENRPSIEDILQTPVITEIILEE